MEDESDRFARTQVHQKLGTCLHNLRPAGPKVVKVVRFNCGQGPRVGGEKASGCLLDRGGSLASRRQALEMEG